MKPVKFKQHNVIYSENQSEYLPLPAYADTDGVVTTCWKLSLLERFKILMTGCFYLQVLTFRNPLQPLRPSINNPLDIEV